MVSFLNYSHENDDRFYQANYLRSRQTLRAPILSERWNLEMGLFFQDVNILFDKVNSSDTNLETNFKIIRDGFTGTSNISWSEAATPEPIAVKGIESLSLVLAEYRRRLTVLEKGLADG